MKGFIKWISGTAVHAEVSKQDAQRIILTNRLAFFAFTTTYIYTICFFIFGHRVAGFSQVPFIALYSLVPLITYLDKKELARITIFVSMICQVALLLFLF